MYYLIIILPYPLMLLLILFKMYKVFILIVIFRGIINMREGFAYFEGLILVDDVFLVFSIYIYMCI
jgi:hypothetical protein